MMSTLLSRLFRAVLVLAAASAACGTVLAQAREPFAALPAPLALDPGKVKLGARLFEDPRFAADSGVSCASCHDLGQGGADTRPTGRVLSTGTGGARHIYNTPTVYNAGLNYRQQWTGGSRTLEEVVDKVVVSPLVFNSSWAAVLGKLSADKALAADFQRLYPQSGLTRETVRDSLAVFMRSLTTPSRFDRYLLGEIGALSEDEQRGMERFKSYGCVSCHQGVNIGGNMLHRFGAMNDYFADKARDGRPSTDGDQGRYRVTQKAEDLHVFRVPSLRNVALTAPYFHDGSAATLEVAVDVMFHYQLGRTAPPQDKALIVKFLHSLTGEQFKTR